ncbi:hypothetical protein PR202_ga24401 [Eleusine coracana subsp. coracana]|uniref:Agenet domain-containing protein n=1 Tax=Eleusine coracana subsp. coracana TaxID=191504 RepID=A0AAV5D8P9_ELECO|nr:hypothetical protein PR202_ga24401 [Eleusine coracana subsp. coracana]
MGRPRGRKRARAQADDAAGDEQAEPAAALFPVGAAVEVRSDDQGFAGSFYEATVEAHLPDARGYLVAYATLTRREDGTSPHREHVAAAHVRPRPPRQDLEFAVHEAVEAFHHDGWWAGVVVRRVQPPAEADGGGEGPRPRAYMVCFPTTREVLEFHEARLRPRLVFLGDRWVPAAHAENRSPMFRVGSQVEVSRSPKTFGQHWSPATVLKVIDATSFLVQYEHIREDGELVTEIMDAQYIRPGRDNNRMDSKYRFPPSSFVEVFYEGSWWPGVYS